LSGRAQDKNPVLLDNQGHVRHLGREGVAGADESHALDVARRQEALAGQFLDEVDVVEEELA